MSAEHEQGQLPFLTAAMERPYFSAVKEAGRWERGVWATEASERCDHRHRTEDAAAECLRSRWGDGKLNVAREGWGTVVEVAGRQERVARVVRPDRFTERTVRCGNVKVCTRRYRHESQHPKLPGWMWSIDIEAGQWKVGLACASWSFDQSRGLAVGIEMLFDFGPDGMVSVWHRAARSADVLGDDDGGVVVRGPWSRVGPPPTPPPPPDGSDGGGGSVIDGPWGKR